MRWILFAFTAGSLLGQSRMAGPAALAGKMKTDERIAALSKALAQQNRSAPLRNQLARVYIQKMRETVDFGYLDRASSLVDSVLARDPGNYESLRLRAEIGMERHEFASVAEYCEELSHIAPNDASNWATLGDSLMELGQYDKASDAYDKMLSYRPDLAAYNRIAWLRFVTGHVDEAIGLMKSAIQADSPAAENVAWCWNDLGNIYFKTGRTPEAEAAYDKALETFPGYFPAHAGRGRLRAAQHRWKPAIEDFQHAQATVPMPEFAAALEDLFTLSGNPAEAKKQRDLLDAIDKMNQASGEKTNRNLALLFADHDRNLARAAELAGNEIKVRPDVYTYDALGWVQYKQKRYAEALESARRAIGMSTPEPAFYYHAGLIAEAAGLREDAARWLRRAGQLNADFDVVQSVRLKRELAALQ